MKRLLLSALLISSLGVLLQACAPQFQSEADCGFVQNVYGQRISWKGRVPIPLYIHASYPSVFVGVLERAIKTWETSLGRPLFYIAGSTNGPLEPRRDGSNVIYWMSSWEANRTTEQARTSVYWEGDEIREADIRINAKDFTFYDSAPTNYRDVHLESLIIHELGHVLGLKHNDGSQSVMATYLSSQSIRTDISAADKSSIKCEY